MTYSGSITSLRTHIKRMGGEHYEAYRRSCQENGITVNKAAVPDEMKQDKPGQGVQQPIMKYAQAEQRASRWDKDTSIELILDFIIETDQVCDILTGDHHVANFPIGT